MVALRAARRFPSQRDAETHDIMSEARTIKPRAFAGRLTKEFKDAMFRQVIAEMESLPEFEHEALKALFPESAHSARSREEALRKGFWNDDAILVVLNCWAHLNPDLRSKVQALFINVALPAEDADRLQWTLDFGAANFQKKARHIEGAAMAAWLLDLERLATELFLSVAEEPGDDVVLPHAEENSHVLPGVDEVAEASPDAMAQPSDLVNRVMSLLDTEPEDSVFWDDISPLTTAIGHLSVAKLTARSSSALRTRVIDTLEALEQTYRAELEYFECGHVVKDLSAFDTNALEQIERDANTLSAGLEEYRHVSHEKPRTARGDRERVALVADIGTRIMAVARRVCASPSEEPEPPPVDSVGSPQSPSQPGEPSGSSPTGTVPKEASAADQSVARTNLSSSDIENEPATTAPSQPTTLHEAVPEPTVAGARTTDQPHEHTVVEVPTADTTEPASEPRIAGEAETTPPPPTTDLTTGVLARTAVGDFTGAYWIARAIEQTGERSPIASSVVAVTEAFALVEHSDSPAVSEIAQLMQGWSPRDGDDHIAALCALLPLLPRLRQGFVETARWLGEDDDYRFMRMVAEPVIEFHNRGHVLSVAALEPVSTRKEAETALLHASNQCQGFLARARKHTTTFARAHDVWQALLGGNLKRLLTPAAENRRGDRSRVAAEIRELGTQELRMARFNDLAATLPGRRVPQIVGEARNQLTRWTEEAIEHAQAWLDAESTLASHEQAANGYIQQQCQELQRNLRAATADAGTHATMLLQSEVGGDRAIGRLCMQALDRLATVLKLERTDAHPEAHLPAADHPETLSARLASRLLLCPGIQLSDRRTIAPEHFEAVALTIGQQPWPVPVSDVESGWLALHDFRWVESLTTLATPDAAEEMLRHTRRAEEDARAILSERIGVLNTEVERAVVDGIVPAEYRSLPAFAPYADVGLLQGNIGQHLNAIDRETQAVIERRTEAIERRRDDWHHKHESMVRSRWPQADAVTTIVERAFERQDVRLIDEYLATLPRLVSRGLDAPQQWFEGGGARFLNAFASAHATGSDAATAMPADEGGDARLLTAWDELTRLGRGDRPQDQQRALADVLTAIGFRLESSGASFTMRAKAPTWTQWSVRMHDNEARLVPQFGTESNGEQQVFCMWGGMPALQAALRGAALDRRVGLGLLFARLNAAQRQAAAAEAQREGVTLALLDSVLVRHIGGLSPEVRLEAFLQIALAYSTANPYRPDVRGPVPREVFFGRRQSLEDLLSDSGPCIVYGGRRLGKSALMEEARQQFHDPSRDKYAVVMDINSVGDPKAKLQPEEIWNVLREELKRVKFLGAKISTSKASDLTAHILDVLGEKKELRLMFDEADDFLDADAERNFHNVNEFRDLMRRSSGRVKAIFAGLHHVQRFQSIPNHPLAAFGLPINVGPLQPEDAYELVLKPMERIGLGFDEPSTVLRVLAATNYHPGLLQLFCSELVRRVSGSKRTQPPRVVTRPDVDAVYNQLHDEIRNRFEWTLRLDDHFQGIARSFAYHQLDEPNDQIVSADRLMDIVRQLWPDGLADVTRDRFIGYLDELVGLGVMVNDDRGYRFRSPNLLHLLGRQEELIEALIELGQRAKDRPSSFDEHHRQLDARSHRFSTFSHSQESRLAATGRVGLVFASPALGLDRVAESVSKFAVDVPLKHGRRVEPLPSGVSDAAAWVAAYRQKHSYSDNLLVFVSQTTNGKGLRASLASWIAMTDDQTGIVALLNPEATRLWSLLSEADRRTADRQVLAVTPEKLSERSLRQRLKVADFEPSAAVTAEILRVTGGWPMLFEEMMGSGRQRRDLATGRSELSKALADPLSSLSKRFIESVGIDVFKEARSLARAYVALGGTYPADLIPAALQDAGDKSEESTLSAAVEFLLRLGILVPSTTTPGDVVVDAVVQRLI